jgi:hypothetical protein
VFPFSVSTTGGNPPAPAPSEPSLPPVSGTVAREFRPLSRERVRAWQRYAETGVAGSSPCTHFDRTVVMELCWEIERLDAMLQECGSEAP